MAKTLRPTSSDAEYNTRLALQGSDKGSLPTANRLGTSEEVELDT